RDEAIRLARKESITSEDREYRKLLKVADKNFDKESFEKAKELYTRAVKFRSNDPYPKEKLAEIEAILNPVVEESVQLEDLGDPYDGSIIDGGFLLKQAENKRRLEKGIQIKSELDKVGVAAAELEAKKSADRREVINDIYALQQTIRQENIDSDESRLATIEALRAAELERQKVERQNQTFEKAENLSSQATLDQIQEEVALDYMENHDVYMDNAAVVEHYNSAQAKALVERSGRYKDLSLQTDQVLHDISVDIADERASDYEQRELAGREVGKSVKYASDVYGELDGKNYQQNLKQKEGIDKVYSKYESKFVEGKKATDDNHEEMKVVRANVNDMTAFRETVESEHRTDVEGQIKEVKLKMIAEQQDFTDEQRESNEKLHQIKVSHSDAQSEAYSREKEKYLQNRALLEGEERQRKNIDEKAKDAHSDKVAYVEGMQKKAISNHSQAEMSDEEERLNARGFVENVELGRSDKQEEARQKHDKSVASFESVNKSVNKQKENNALKQRDKVLDAQSKLSDVDATPKKKIKTANALGQEYPEGVSQESFT
ncbi:calponin homology domain-containing protein DDB_G0272472, partial [Exaiptasia diaphana]|uniref:Uncharacterized protein n=1 Tax=Exaiptasia diaphana TaxID=2652724 RepID=A0A913XF58_EXADI